MPEVFKRSSDDHKISRASVQNPPEETKHIFTPVPAGVKGGDVLPHGAALHADRVPKPHAGDCWPDHA